MLAEKECTARMGPVLSLLAMRRAGTVVFDPARLAADECESLLRQALDQHLDVIIARADP